MGVKTIEEWKKLLGDRRLVDYELLEEATGIKRKTLSNYVTQGRMPRPDAPGRWFADREDLALWVIGETRPGQGRRTDLEKRAKE